MSAMGEQGMLGNGYQSQNLTYISHNISHFGHHHALLPALFVLFCFYHSSRGRTGYFILFRLPPVEEVFTQRLEDQLLSSCQSGQASAL